MQTAILTCAPTGAIHTPSMSPYLPVTVEEIATAALEAAEGGAAIVHLHVRDPEDGHPVQDVGLFRDLLARIADASDVVVNLTTGGSPHMTVEERVAPAVQLAPELASLNMGTMNFGLYPMLDRFTDLRHEWERTHLGNKDLVFKNTFADIERILRTCGDQGTRFEFECYDTSHLYNLAHMRDRGLVQGPLFVQTVVGLLGGIGADVEDLLHMRRTAIRLLGDDIEWSVLGAGAAQTRTAAIALSLGGNARVGLEDSLWDGPGRLATSSRAQVDRVRTIASALHRDIATPQEARRRLALRDADEAP
ncbi:3-keto-5-aminohexanoate cleavage protein [Nocardioides sp. CFH 31398]|uniref:3-keto-5-aminohexanoate cleavage protein n=1 Tax=Nocardioides sp. CFH 31398 TaxID=2919579 RepID=UPI001F05774F|nr:3-keto-5-aminohexanoate cleavage protein [Nocardioides sp. CFH 31398]MCH1867822.1 3-keto-5-aminohexanoate cleavage protein [Nocardioides sp. CFH 31398]